MAAEETAMNFHAAFDNGYLEASWSFDAPSCASQKISIVPALLDGTAEVSLPSDARDFISENADASQSYRLQLQTFDGSGDVLMTQETTVAPSAALLPDLRVTEVEPDPLGSDDAEWIEIGNLGEGAAMLDGFVLRDKSGRRFALPAEVLSPQNFLVLAKSATNLTLPNAGGRIELLDAQGTVRDSMEYPESPEGISFGRNADNPTLLQFFCAPTPGQPNATILPTLSLTLESGALTGIDSTSANFKLDLTGAQSRIHCSIDFGDGTVSTSCNPGSHVFHAPGHTQVHATATNYCNNTVEQYVDVFVQESQQSSSVSSNVSSSSSRAATNSSASAKQTSRCSPTAFDGISIARFEPNPEGDDATEWIELASARSETSALCGWVIDDDDAGSTPFGLDGLTIAANGRLILDRTLTKIALNNNGDSVRLFGPGNDLQDLATYDDAPSGAIFVRQTDGQFTFNATQSSSSSSTKKGGSSSNSNQKIEGSTALPLPALILSAALPNPKGNDTGHEWIEIWNDADHDVDLQNFRLKNKKGTQSKPFSKHTVHAKSTIRLSSDEIGLMLGNTSSSIMLMTSDGRAVSTLSWEKAQDDDVIRPRLASEKNAHATVLDVIDGDTIDVRLKDGLSLFPGFSKFRVRFIGIDAPELSSNDPTINKLASESKKFLLDLLENKNIELQFDTEIYDAYDRVLAYIVLSDGSLAQKKILESGKTLVYDEFPFSKLSEFRAYEMDAEENRRGIFSLSNASDIADVIRGTHAHKKKSSSSKSLASGKLAKGIAHSMLHTVARNIVPSDESHDFHVLEASYFSLPDGNKSKTQEISPTDKTPFSLIFEGIIMIFGLLYGLFLIFNAVHRKRDSGDLAKNADFGV
jgi:endonuclease YncB( thermonuclease family)